jgi:transposase InsO family protein
MALEYDRDILCDQQSAVIIDTNSPRDVIAGPGRQANLSSFQDLAVALFEYLGIFHNRQRRHSSLGMLTPIDFETRRESVATSTGA